MNNYKNTIEDPRVQDFSKLAKKLFKQPKAFSEGMMLFVEEISPMVKVDEVHDFCMYWINKQVQVLPHGKQFRDWIFKHRNDGYGEKEACSFYMCEGEGYIERHKVNDEKQNVYADKICACVLGSMSAFQNKMIGFEVTEWQQRIIERHKNNERIKNN